MCTLPAAVFCDTISHDDDKNQIMDFKSLSKIKTFEDTPIKHEVERRWVYRGEGNRCLVVADSKKQIVYRLVKQPCKEHIYLHQTQSNDKSKRIHSLLKDMADYMTNVLGPHLSPHFAISPKLVEMRRDFLDSVADNITPFRPERRQMRGLDPACLSALTLPDLCFIKDCPTSPHIPTISVEIKPKRGVLPVNCPISNSTPVMRAPCRFCMHQTLKVKQKMWPNRSKYCPVDLFSGNVCRMKKALLGLLDTPQNNLKIFKNGVEIYPRLSISQVNSSLVDFFSNRPTHPKRSNLHQLVDLVVRALLWSPTDRGDNNPLTASTLPRQFCDVSSDMPKNGLSSNDSHYVNELPKGCVLDRIRHIQLMDQLEIDSIYPLYQQLQSHVSERPLDRYKWNLDGPYSDEWLPPFVEPCQPVDTEHAIKKIKTFLMSTTASDCSVMIAIHPSSPSNEHSANSHVTHEDSSNKVTKNQSSNEILGTNHTVNCSPNEIACNCDKLEYSSNEIAGKCRCVNNSSNEIAGKCNGIRKLPNEITDNSLELKNSPDNVSGNSRVKHKSTNDITRNCYAEINTSNEIAGRCHVIHSDSGQEFDCSIGIIDLDPKPYGKIPTYFKRNAEIISSYQSLSE